MNEKGITLIEIMITLVVGVVIFGGAAGSLFYLNLLRSSMTAETLVYQDLATVLERIDNTSLNNLNSRYLDGEPLSGAEVQNILGGYRTTAEQITVSYPSGAAANPREILVTASWTDRGRARITNIQTFKRG